MNRLARRRDQILRSLLIFSCVMSGFLLLLWVISDERAPGLYRDSPTGLFEVAAYRGRLWFVSQDPPTGATGTSFGLIYPRVEDVGLWPAGPPPQKLREQSEFLGFLSIGYPGTANTVDAIPFWAPLALLTWYQACWLGHRHIHRRRTAAGTCIHCGYDLRASPLRCPECGHEVGLGRVEALPVISRHRRSGSTASARRNRSEPADY